MEDGSFVKQRLTDASKTKTLARRLSLIFATAALALGVFLVIALTDYWLILPEAARFGGVLLLLMILAAGLLRVIASFRRTADLKEAALDAEALKADAGCELSTAAEYLSGQRKPTQEYESELAAALEQRAAGHLQSLQVSYWNRPVPAALFLGACGVAAALFALVASGGLTAFARAAAPWKETPYTRVEVQPGSVEIPMGKDIEIKSVFSGRIPEKAQLSWQNNGNAQWEFASLPRSAQGEYVYPLKNVRTPLKYRVSGNDAVSAEFTVEPYVPPEVKEWNVALQPPAYTGRPSLTQNTPDITVLRGTTASLRIAPSVKLSSAKLRFDDQETVDLQPAQGGYWQVAFPVTRDRKFSIALKDEKGHSGETEKPFQITALPDQPPRVEITDPGQDIRAEATNTVPVKISVTDDYGVSEIRLVYHKLGGPEEYVTAKRDGQTNTEFQAEIPLSSMALNEYELVAYHAEASDNNTLDGPGVGKSDVFFIEVTNEEGGACKSQGKAQRVNLLVIQKQIIADTTALAADAPTEKFNELALRQKDAVDFGNIYVRALAGGGAGEALQEMQSAVTDMGNAQAALEKTRRTEALPPAESALAHLYNVLKFKPELENLPTQPRKTPPSTNAPTLQVVLNAIKKKKEQPENEELQAALDQAQELQDQQKSINLGVQNSGQGQGQGEAEMIRASSESKAQSGKGGKGKSKKGSGKKKGGKESNKDPDSQKEPTKESGEGNKPELDQLAQKENALSKEAAELAQKLARLAGKDGRVGHNAGNAMNRAAGKMGAAAQAMTAGDPHSAGTKGLEGEAELNNAIAALENAINGRPERVDVSQEESPQEYDMVIAEYLKKLSHQE